MYCIEVVLKAVAKSRCSVCRYCRIPGKRFARRTYKSSNIKNGIDIRTWHTSHYGKVCGGTYPNFGKVLTSSPLVPLVQGISSTGIGRYWIYVPILPKLCLSESSRYVHLISGTSKYLLRLNLRVSYRSSVPNVPNPLIGRVSGLFPIAPMG